VREAGQREDRKDRKEEQRNSPQRTRRTQRGTEEDSSYSVVSVSFVSSVVPPSCCKCAIARFVRETRTITYDQIASAKNLFSDFPQEIAGPKNFRAHACVKRATPPCAVERNVFFENRIRVS